MSTVTTNQGIVIPVGTDGADNPQAFIDMIAGVETRLVQRYTSNADRTARNPAPATGEMSIVAGNTWYDRYTGAKWLPCTAIKAFKTTNQTVNNSAVLVNDAELFLPLPVANSYYMFRFGIRYSTNTTADIAFSFSGPAGSTITFGGAGPDTSAASVFNAASNYSDTIAPASLFFGGGATAFVTIYGSISVAGTTGNLQLRFAQAVANASNTTLADFSHGIVEAIA